MSTSDPILAALQKLEAEYHMIIAGLRRIEEQLADERDDRGRLKAEVAGLKARVSELQERIREIEARLED